MQNNPQNTPQLEDQLCFPLYACSREVIKRYRPHLDAIGLTYTQYVAMLVCWEKQAVSVKELGQRLHLDSGTLTPLLKKLEKKNLITRSRSKEDERVLFVTLTDEGQALKDDALAVPEGMKCNSVLTREEAAELYRILYKLLKSSDEAD